jgi:hypothetical protein
MVLLICMESSLPIIKSGILCLHVGFGSYKDMSRGQS